MRVIGYARRSQGEDGLPEYDLREQERLIAFACEERAWELVEVLEEIADVSVGLQRRQALREAMWRVSDGEADALVVSAADRIGLHFDQFGFLLPFAANGRTFIALDIDWDTSTIEGAEAARVIGKLSVDAYWLRVTQARPAWDKRNELIAREIEPGSTVLDLGAGPQTLRELLPEGCEYQPCDRVDSPGVLRCDFNRGIWPRVAKRYEVVVASGVLEYIQDPRIFVERASALGDRMIISHALRSEDGAERTRGWTTHMSEAELTSVFEDIGLNWRLVATWNAHSIFSTSPQAQVEEALR